MINQLIKFRNILHRFVTSKEKYSENTYSVNIILYNINIVKIVKNYELTFSENCMDR